MGATRLRDFDLPSEVGQPERWLREIAEPPGFRMRRVWWALYIDGPRSDVWWYHPGNARSKGKLLEDYSIESIEMETDGGLAVKIWGDMSRPQGAWTLTRRTSSLAPDGGILKLARVRPDFGFFRGHDVGEGSGGIIVSTEREVGDRFQRRHVAAARPEVLARCGFVSPVHESAIEVSLDRYEAVARCGSFGDDAAATPRGCDERSFVEREALRDPAP